MKQKSKIPLLELTNITKYYHSAAPALADVSFSV
ncbi:MAG TPA: phosphonate ABC transporter ATP-binding protein, partial [Firmicutes bacterium]|nr:phosphonate ABC transporter ATP-binding protein [Bacillota bacterium]